MGPAEGKSMLYLEARCLATIRAAGSQGVQNGSISCVALVLSVPGGAREILAENVLAAWLDLEVASGNDAIASHSEIRKTAKLMGQFLPGTDFVTSGYSVMPREDNTFGGGDDVAEAVLMMQRQRVSADYLQTSAIIDPDGTVRSAVSDPNAYEGPGTGYRLEGERWELLQRLPYVLDPAETAMSNGAVSPVRET